MNIKSNETYYVGGVAFFLTYASEYVPYSILILLGAIIGVIGTFLITIIDDFKTNTNVILLKEISL